MEIFVVGIDQTFGTSVSNFFFKNPILVFGRFVKIAV